MQYLGNMFCVNILAIYSFDYDLFIWLWFNYDCPIPQFTNSLLQSHNIALLFNLFIQIFFLDENYWWTLFLKSWLGSMHICIWFLSNSVLELHKHNKAFVFVIVRKWCICILGKSVSDPNPGDVNILFRWIDCSADVIWDYDVSKNAGQLYWWLYWQWHGWLVTRMKVTTQLMFMS